MIVDSHCHLYDRKIKNQKEILSQIETQNQICVCCGDNIKNSEKCIELATKNKNIYATVGVHPHNASEYTNETEKLIKNLSKNPKVVAIGEIGLDYHYDFSPREVQKKILISQIKLAKKLSLPCVFHVREATEDFLNIIDKFKGFFKNSAVVHSFSGSVETAKILIKKGFYLGFNGIVTFENAGKILKVLSFVPLNKILIETDAPYLTPSPFRGKTNEPKYVRLVAKKIAEIKSISENEVIRQTAENAFKLFKIKGNE